MSILAIVLFALGLIGCLVGTIMIIVAAFRTSIVWGIVSFFGLGQLLFLITHWEESKKGFMVSLFGVLMAYGTMQSFGDASISKQIARYLQGNSKPAQFSDSAEPANEGPKTLDELETQLRVAEADLAAAQQKIKVDFNSLMTQRSSLGKDEASLAAYNASVAAYEAQNAALPVKAQLVTDLRAKSEAATQAELEAARNAKKNGTKTASPFAMFSAQQKAATAANAAKANTRGEVVMYTTRTCPACTAAKAYFAKRHVQYREIDVQSDAKGQEEFRKLGGSGVPLILVNGERMEGFDERRLESMLGGSA